MTVNGDRVAGWHFIQWYSCQQVVFKPVNPILTPSGDTQEDLKVVRRLVQRRDLEVEREDEKAELVGKKRLKVAIHKSFYTHKFEKLLNKR